MTNYSKKLKDPRWQKKRLQIMQRDKFKCRLCGDDETTLNVHHLVYHSGHEPWEYENHELITYCVHCHYEVELRKKENEVIEKIHKSDNWTSGKRIMFCLVKDNVYMRIYDDDVFVMGFVLSSDLPDIKFLITKALKHGKP